MSEEIKGWKLVPIEPTEEMVKSGQCDYGVVVFAPHQVTSVYRDMLAAAPEPSASAGMEPLTDAYVQVVPNRCDRIVWKNKYYHLPLDTFAAQLATVEAKWNVLRESWIESNAALRIELDKAEKEVRAKALEDAVRTLQVKQWSSDARDYLGELRRMAAELREEK